ALREHLAIRPEYRCRRLAMLAVVEVARYADDGDERVRRVILAVSEMLSDRGLSRPEPSRDAFRDNGDARRVLAIPIGDRVSRDAPHTDRAEELRPHRVEREPWIRTRFDVRLLLRREAAHPYVRAKERRHGLGRHARDRWQRAHVRHHALVRREVHAL